MKKLLFLVSALTLFTSSFAAFEVRETAKKADQILIPVGNNAQLSLLEISKISIKDFETLTGKHLNFIDRIAFRAGQKKLRHSISADGTINNKKLMHFVDGEGDHSSGFHVGGFLLGFFLGLIGVLIAYVAGGDEAVKKNRAKWSWIGLGVSVVLAVIIAVAI